MKNIAIIPARSGSKGLPDKNIKMLAGKPMLAYTIEAALESGCFDEVHVSTDSGDYAEIARKYGAHVPFLRENNLATDSAGTWDVVKWILAKYRESEQRQFDYMAILQPTSPLRMAYHIREAFQLKEDKKAKMIVSVCEAEHSPLWMNTLPEDHNLNQFINLEKLSAFRQGLPKFYRINGAIYLGDTEYVKNRINYYDQETYAYIMDKVSSIDIDDIFDFHFAEYLMTNKGKI